MSLPAAVKTVQRETLGGLLAWSSWQMLWLASERWGHWKINVSYYHIFQKLEWRQMLSLDKETFLTADVTHANRSAWDIFFWGGVLTWQGVEEEVTAKSETNYWQRHFLFIFIPQTVCGWHPHGRRNWTEGRNKPAWHLNKPDDKNIQNQ